MRGAIRWLRTKAGPIDIVLTLLLVGLAQVEVWTMKDPGTARPLLSFVALAMTAPFVLRRRQPLLMTAIAMAALAVSTFAWETPDKAIFPTLAIVLSVYAVAAHLDLRGAIVGAAFVFAPVFGHQVGVQHQFGDAVFIAVMVGSVWVAGRGVRGHRQRAELIADRARAVERQAAHERDSAVAEERLRIARELHDVVAHSVSVMTVQAGAERRARGDEDETQHVLTSIEQTGRQAMTEMRRLLGVLRAGNEDLALAPQPGMEHLDVLVAQVRASGLPVDWNVEGDARPLAPGIDLAAYRVIQEALTNSLKHAGPAHATVTVRYQPTHLEIEAADDGRGADRSRAGGHGLIGMHERVALYGGELEVGDVKPHGYLVRARLPLSPPTA
jgi:signal transduction histidine kinase